MDPQSRARLRASLEAEVWGNRANHGALEQLLKERYEEMKEKLVTCDVAQLVELRAETRALKKVIDTMTKPPLSVRSPVIPHLTPSDLTT